MGKLSKIKSMLQSMLEQFSQLSTDGGLLTWVGEEELPEIGDVIMVIDEEGNESKAENGEYRAENGKVIIIEDGKVSEIRDAEPVEEPAEEPEEQPQEEPQEEPAEEPENEPEQPAEEPQEEPEEQPEEQPEEDEKDKRIADLESEVARLEEENGALKERIKELEEKSAADPANEAFEKINRIEKTGNKKIDRLIDLVNAK